MENVVHYVIDLTHRITDAQSGPGPDSTPDYCNWPTFHVTFDAASAHVQRSDRLQPPSSAERLKTVDSSGRYGNDSHGLVSPRGKFLLSELADW